MSNLKTIAQKIDDVLDLAAAPPPEEIVSTKPAEITSSGDLNKDMEEDFAIARSTLRNLVEKGVELVDNANFFAREKQDARSVEAAAIAQKEARDNAMALLNMHKTRKDIEKTDGQPMGGPANITQNNVAFIGTTAELLKQMREMKANNPITKALTTIDVNIVE